jgi:uncharacterized surface protein with fasciclin (FAS1) repeats
VKEAAMATKVLAALAAAAGALMLPACSGDDADEPGDGTAEVSDETLASVVEDADGLSVVSDVLGDAGLAQVFDGAASYTLFAPQDGAFDALGETGEDLRSPEQRAAMVAILRDHIVPGYLTPDDIANAIDVADDGSVEMRTMGDHTLTFTGEGETITVTGEDGASARFVGDALRASNGVAIPLDGVLKKVSEAPAG